MNLLEKIYAAAIDAVHPSTLMPKALSLHGDRLQLGEEVVPLGKFKKIYVAGAGKATAAMAKETENILNGLITDGVVSIKDEPSEPFNIIRPFISGHPLPDANSVMAAEEIMRLVKKTDKDDLLIFLLSGGASSLVTDLPPFCTLNDIHATSRLLINCGASIHEINVIRKHLSAIKGGQLAKACRANLVTFIISDVTDNDLSVIGSGPTVPDNSRFEDALDILHKYNLMELTPSPVINHLRNGTNNSIADTPPNNDASFKNCRNYIIADIHIALKAAEAEARNLGFHTTINIDLLKGDAETAAKKWSDSLSLIDSSGKACLITGGETTVDVKGSGKGGRNQHFALAASIALKDSGKNISLLSAGTDGSDGPTDAAGAVATNNTYKDALAIRVQPEEYLKNNDSYTFFQLVGGHLKTGATHTNVMDVVITLM